MDKDEGTKENRIPSKKELKDAKAELSSAFLDEFSTYFM